MRLSPVAAEKIAVLSAILRRGGTSSCGGSGGGSGAPDSSRSDGGSTDKRRAIVRARRGPSAASLRHGQHPLTDQAQRPLAPRAPGEPAVHVVDQDVLPSAGH